MKSLPTLLTIFRIAMGPVIAALVLWAASVLYSDRLLAGFIYALLRGWSTDEVLRFANAAAAVSCTRLGALGGVPELGEVEELVASGKVRG